MPPSSRRSQQKKSSSERIREYANKKGVTIKLDVKATSQEAKMDSPFSYSEKTRTLLIVAPLLEKQDPALLYEIIRKVFEEGELILKVKTEQVLESYREYSNQNKYNNILEFFAGVLSQDDYAALKMSLYLRYQMSQKLNVQHLKQDIRDRYGDRGANIANLCTAGYFEKYFMPLFNQLSKKEFLDEYELTVGIKAKALFVHSAMTLEEIEEEFYKMLAKAIKYHIKEFAIHGMGTRNVDLIKEFVETITNTRETSAENNFIIKKSRESEKLRSIEYTVTMIPQKTLD